MDLRTQLNFKQLQAQDLLDLANEFAKNCASPRQPADEAMIPSQIYKKDFFLRSTNGAVLVMDIGGTNIKLAYSGLVLKSSENLDQINLQDVFTFKNLSGQVTLQQYADYLVTQLSSYLAKYPQDKFATFAISFSYPTKINQQAKNLMIDRTHLQDYWGKGLTVNGSNINLSEYLRDILSSKGIEFKQWLALNDVVALGLCDKNAVAALVIGTGYNIALVDKNSQVYNTEAGLFSNPYLLQSFSLPAQKLLAAYQENNNGSKHVGEYQVSGKHLYQILKYSLQLIQHSDLALIDAIDKLTSEIFTLVLDQKWQQIEHVYQKTMLPETKLLLTQLCELIIERSIDIVAAELCGGLLYSAAEMDIGAANLIVASGSIVQNVPGYLLQLQQKVSELYGKSVEFKVLENGALTGAALATLYV